MQDPVDDRDALFPRRGRVLGSRHVERALVERADENVGERGNGLRHDGSGLDRRLQPELHQAETVLVGQVPPRLPAEHGRGVEEDDPLDLGRCADVEEQPGTRAQRSHRVGRRLGSGRARDPLCDLRLDLFRHGGEQVGLVAELVVQGAASHPGSPDDLLRAHLRKTARAEQRTRCGHQPPPGRLGAQIVLGPGHPPAASLAIRTVCM